MQFFKTKIIYFVIPTCFFVLKTVSTKEFRRRKKLGNE